MAHYRIYLLRTDGSILSASDAECADDGEARKAAQASAQPGHQTEVWTGTRCLGRVLPASITA